MIVVLGRPRAVPIQGAGSAVRWAPGGRAVAIARAAVAAGARVEMVGSVGDDGAGDDVVVGLSRERIGHAALLRDPRGRTPLEPPVDAGALPRLDRADVELGLGYLLDWDVLVLAEELVPDTLDAALEAARYRAAAVVAVADPGRAAPTALAGAAIVEAPAGEDPAFDARIGRMAAETDGATRRPVGAGGARTDGRAP